MTDPTPPTTPTSVTTSPPSSVNTSRRAKAPSSPSPEFIRDVTLAIRNGASPYVAAEWAGVPRKTYQRWMRTHDGLRVAVRKATAALKVKLQTDLARKSPEKALRRLHVNDERADAGRRHSKAPRPYLLSGITLVQKALPHLVERVNDATLPNHELTPVEIAARAWRDDVLADLGGRDAVATTKLAALDVCVRTKILLDSIDAYLFELAADGGLANRKHRTLFPVVEQRQRIADSLSRQLQTIGLDKPAPKVPSLHEYLATRSASEPDTAEPALTTATTTSDDNDEEPS